MRSTPRVIQFSLSLFTAVFLVAITQLITPIAPARPQNGFTQRAKDAIQDAYGRLPLSFEANRGQTDDRVQFVSRGKNLNLFLSASEAVLALYSPAPNAVQDNSSAQAAFTERQARPALEQAVVRMQLIGSNPNARAGASKELPGKSNYFLGNDSAKWRVNMPTYSKITYQAVYSGVDLTYYGNQQQLEYDFIVAPGADPKIIRLALAGAEKLALNQDGDLVLQLTHGQVSLHKPVIYQELEGKRRVVPGGYVLGQNGQIGFQVGEYDTRKPLVIDPVFGYSTAFGGRGIEVALGIAVDSAGNAYITGYSESPDFPTTNAAFQSSPRGTDLNPFVVKLNPTGDTMLYSTYLGGSSDSGDQAFSVAVDGQGNAYITGSTLSADFPLVNPIQSVWQGRDAFVAKLNATGNTLLYSTFLGGNGSDIGLGIALDAQGNMYIAGDTTSTDFPTANPIQSVLGGQFDTFLTKLNPTGTTLLFSTYLGGTGQDFGRSIALDTSGNAYVAGITSSSDFPTANAVQSVLRGAGDAFISEINTTGNGLIYSTYLGGSNSEIGGFVAVDTNGNAYIVGATISSDFPTFLPIQANLHGNEDAFLVKLTPGGAFGYATYLGGSDRDYALGVAVDSEGVAYLTGATSSTDFPPVDPLQPALDGSFDTDAIVVKVSPSGNALLYSSYLGGSRIEEGFGIALDAAKNIYVVGETASVNFPVTVPYHPDNPFPDDTFVVKFLVSGNTPAGSNVAVAVGNDVNLTFANVTAAGNTSVTVQNTGPTLPAGFVLNATQTYYDITTSAAYAPPVQVCLAYNPAQYTDASNLRLLHYENAAWVDVTATNNTTANVICGQVSSLSPFVVVQSKYHYSGFFQPVDNQPTLNVVNAGRAIPVKFSLGGNQGLAIFDTGYPKSGVVPCDSTAPVDVIEETITAGASSLSYDGNQYIYVWNTDKSWAGTCRQLVIRLNDLSYHRATFKFK